MNPVKYQSPHEIVMDHIHQAPMPETVWVCFVFSSLFLAGGMWSSQARCQIRAIVTCGNAGSLSYCARPGIAPQQEVPVWVLGFCFLCFFGVCLFVFLPLSVAYRSSRD